MDKFIHTFGPEEDDHPGYIVSTLAPLSKKQLELVATRAAAYSQNGMSSASWAEFICSLIPLEKEESEDMPFMMD